MEDNESKLQPKADQRHIEDCYNDLVKTFGSRFAVEERERIKNAFEFANQAHAGSRRKSGTPFIIHPLLVAKIATSEIGLGVTSIISAILHDVVEDTDYTIEDIHHMFGAKIAQIVDGLTKLTDEMIQQDSKQAANFRKMLMTLSDDVRVILIKLADRLHNMRTLDSMPVPKQLEIAAETLFIFAPLAHRLGLYAIKTELEDLSLKYQQPATYNLIRFRIESQRVKRDYLVNEFVEPIKKQMEIENIDFIISERLKSVYSIWEKMQNKGVTFDEIYDLLAVRIVFKPKEIPSEKRQCFDILSIITDIYKPKPDRIRDWITIPKANGYEALHVTVMGPQGKWVEVQIRTERMDEIAERGYAAHYKYKVGQSNESELDKWLAKIQELLQDPDSDALEFINEFKMNLYSSEIVVFTPKGDMITMPKGSTVIDFAYEIHSDLGNHCMGAKIGRKLVPTSHILESGDQIEILTLKTQTPDINWLKFIATAKAKNKLKQSLKLDDKNYVETGREILENKLNEYGIKPTSDTLKKIAQYYTLSNKEQLYSQTGMGFIDLSELERVLKSRRKNKIAQYWELTFNRKNANNNDLVLPETKINKKNTFILTEQQDDSASYTLATCCQPIPGDDVLGYMTSNNHVVIHKRNCKEAVELTSQRDNRTIEVEWTKFKKKSFLCRLKLNGFDRVGILNEVTNIISKQNNINMRTVKFDAHDGIFEGDLFLYIHNTEDLERLIELLSKIKGIDNIKRDENLDS